MKENLTSFSISWILILFFFIEMVRWLWFRDQFLEQSINNNDNENGKESQNKVLNW